MKCCTKKNHAQPWYCEWTCEIHHLYNGLHCCVQSMWMLVILSSPVTLWGRPRNTKHCLQPANSPLTRWSLQAKFWLPWWLMAPHQFFQQMDHSYCILFYLLYTSLSWTCTPSLYVHLINSFGFTFELPLQRKKNSWAAETLATRWGTETDVRRFITTWMFQSWKCYLNFLLALRDVLLCVFLRWFDFITQYFIYI